MAFDSIRVFVSAPDRLVRSRFVTNLVFWLCLSLLAGGTGLAATLDSHRERISIDENWRFTKGDPTNNTVSLLYDTRQTQTLRRFAAEADGNATINQSNQAAGSTESTNPVALIKQWILPTGNEFIKDASRKFVRPEGNLGDNVAYVRPDFDDHSWPQINLPHDWAIAGPFIRSGGGGMGRLPSAGIGWYRKKLDIPANAAGQMIFLDMDGAMSYATVWLNGQIVGGWPFGYASWCADLTPFVKFGGQNELVIRLDNPPNSSRWYPGAGIYRNVWLVETSPVHVGHWGTCLTTPEVSKAQAKVNLQVTVDNDSKQGASITVTTKIFALDADGRTSGKAVAGMAPMNVRISPGSNAVAEGRATIANPKLWGRHRRKSPIATLPSRPFHRTGRWWTATKHHSASAH